MFLDEQLLPRWTAEAASGPAPLAADRLTLRQILLSGLEDAVTFGKTCTGVAPANSRITAQTRALFSDDMFNVFTAIVGPGSAFVGVAPVEFPEPMDQAVARHAPDVRLRDVRDYMTVSYGTRREHLPHTDEELHRMTGTELRAMVLDLIDGWHPRVQRIVRDWDPASIFPTILRTSVPIEPWPTSAVTLLGDAIHAMSPAGGVGANTALRDAATLADALHEAAHGHPLVAALREYEAAMTGYGFAAVRASADNGHRFLGQNPLPTA